MAGHGIGAFNQYFRPTRCIALLVCQAWLKTPFSMKANRCFRKSINLWVRPKQSWTILMAISLASRNN
jgi:hypothetical protein